MATAPTDEPVRTCSPTCEIIPIFRLRVDRRGEHWHAFDQHVCVLHIGERVETMVFQYRRITVQQYNPATGDVVKP